MTVILVLCVLTFVTALVCLVFVYDAYKQLNLYQELNQKLIGNIHTDLITHDEYCANALNEINKKSVRSYKKKENSQN